MPKRKREKEKKKRNEKQRAAQSRAERTRCAHARALAPQVGRASGERGSGRQGGVRGLFTATERGGHRGGVSASGRRPALPAAFRTVGSGGGCGPLADGGSQAGAGAQLCLKHPAHTEAGTEVELTGPLPNERTLRADHRRARKPRSSGTAGPVLSSAASVRSAGAAPRPRDPRRPCQALLGTAQDRLGRGGARLAASVLLGADARAQGVLSHTGSGCPPAGEWVGAGRG